MTWSRHSRRIEPISLLPSAGPVCPWREGAERTEHRRCNPDHGPYNVVSRANQKPRPIAAQSILRPDGRLLPTKEVPDEHAAETEFHTTTGTKLSAPQTDPLRRCPSMIVEKRSPALARW